MYRVIKQTDLFADEDHYSIIDEDSIERCNFCDCYDNYGGKVGCHDAGCITKENAEEYCYPFDDGDEHHTEVMAITWWDGHNHKSLIVEHLEIEDCTDVELLDEDDPLSIKILQQFETADFPEYDAGVAVVETKDCIFKKTLFPDFAIANVEMIVAPILGEA